MKILSGAERPDIGQLVLDGAPFRPESPEAARRRGRLESSTKSRCFCADLSVRENILLGNEPTRRLFIDVAGSRDIAQRALQQVGVSGAWGLETPLRQLSPAESAIGQHCAGAVERRLQGLDLG